MTEENEDQVDWGEPAEEPEQEPHHEGAYNEPEEEVTEVPDDE